MLLAVRLHATWNLAAKKLQAIQGPVARCLPGCRGVLSLGYLGAKQSGGIGHRVYALQHLAWQHCQCVTALIGLGMTAITLGLGLVKMAS